MAKTTTTTGNLPDPVPSYLVVSTHKAKGFKGADLYNKVRLDSFGKSVNELFETAATTTGLKADVGNVTLYRQDAIAWALLSKYGQDHKGLELWAVDMVTTCAHKDEARRTFKTTLQRLCKVVTDGEKELVITEQRGKDLEVYLKESTQPTINKVDELATQFGKSLAKIDDTLNLESVMAMVSASYNAMVEDIRERQAKSILAELSKAKGMTIPSGKSSSEARDIEARKLAAMIG